MKWDNYTSTVKSQLKAERKRKGVDINAKMEQGGNRLFKDTLFYNAGCREDCK